MKKNIYFGLVILSSLNASASSFLNTSKAKDKILLTKVNCAQVRKDVEKAMLNQGFSQNDAHIVGLTAEDACNGNQV